jgi:hypothetical protein
VLVLPPSFFMPTSTYAETFGMSDLAPIVKTWQYMEALRNPQFLNDPRNSSIVRDLLPRLEDQPPHIILSSIKRHGIPFLNEKPLEVMEVPLTGLPIANIHNEEQENKFEEWLTAKFENHVTESLGVRIDSFVGSSYILHTHRHDVQLMLSCDFGISTLCRGIVRLDLSTIRRSAFPDHSFDHNRLNMLATIPELSLVLVASQEGRVALLTITRHVRKSKELSNTVTFRVEHTLPPFEYDINLGTPRVSGEGLLGMAVGPMQGDMERFSRNPSVHARKFRLLLHYYDHTILSYELSRDPVTQEILAAVF